MEIHKLEIGLAVIISSEYKDNKKLIGHKARVLWKPEPCVEGSLILLGLECDYTFAKTHNLHSGFDLVPAKALGLYKGYCIWADLNEFNQLY